MPGPEKSGVAGHNRSFYPSFTTVSSFPANIMATPNCARSLARASGTFLRPNGHRSAFYNSRRGLATAADDGMTLPLKGIKVLDMTRVLAGVSTLFLAEMMKMIRLIRAIAILYPNTGRSRVRAAVTSMAGY